MSRGDARQPSHARPTGGSQPPAAPPARPRIMKIPYGISDFGHIRSQGFFYADKTPFLPVLERAESSYSYLLFLRPRRFGKSTLLSLLEHYYDINKKDQFDALFKGLWIHEHPTAER